jgi:hypothetical protein
MTKKCYALLLVVPLMAFGSTPKETVTPETVQVAYMVWDAGCINKIEVGKNTRIEAPMKDGEPDMTKAVIYKEIADFNKLCGHIEIRRENASEIRSDKSKAEE